MSTCRSCQAEVVWVATDRRKMPLDPDPVPDGNVVRLDGDTARVLSKAELAANAARPESQRTPLYRSHFSSCPDSASWRRR